MIVFNNKMFEWLFVSEKIDISIELDGIKYNDNNRKNQLKYELNMNKQLIDDEEVINYPSFDIDGKVSGRIYINVPIGKQIYHNGLKVSLEQYVAFLYPKLTADLYRIDLVLSKEGILEGNNIIPFEMPLIERDDDKKSNSTNSDLSISLSRISCTKDNGVISSRAEACLFDSYEGVAFSLRHHVIVQVLRPWYARSFIVHKDLRLFRVNIPHETALREEITMQIRDCGGKCTVYVPSKWVDIVTSPKIGFTVAIRDLKRPIVAMYVFLIRAEFIEDEHLDEVILLHRVFGEKIQTVLDAVPDRACYSEGFESRVDDTDEDPRPDDPIMRGANLAFTVYLTSKSVCLSRNIDYDDISEQIPNQKYMGDFKKEVVTRRTAAVVKETNREVKPILLLSPSFDTCSAGLDYIRMENEDDSDEKLPEIRSADWTESNKNETKITTDTSNTAQDKNNKIEIKKQSSNDDDENEMLRDSISLRYFVRVLVQDAAGRSCWDTTEIKLYRGGKYVSIIPVAAAIPDV